MTWVPPATDAEAELRRCVMLDELLPGWRDLGPVLYVGANPQRHQLLGELHGMVEVLEIWAPYAVSLSHAIGPWASPGSPLERVRWLHLGDVTQPDEVPAKPVGGELRYALAVWWHGPEHVSRYGAARALASLLDVASAVVVGCPVGEMEQGPVDENPHQTHVSSWEPRDFEGMGFRVLHEGRGRGSSLVAVAEMR